MTNAQRSRLNPDTRKTQILNTALDYANEYGLQNITREKIATRADVSPALIGRYFTMDQLRSDVVNLAITTQCLRVIRDGIVLGYESTKNIPEELRTAAKNTL